MRSTHEVIDAARFGEACTEEELRLCIVSMRTTALHAHQLHARWAVDQQLPEPVRKKAAQLFTAVAVNWSEPLEARVSPDYRPGAPGVRERAAAAEHLFARALLD